MHNVLQTAQASRSVFEALRERLGPALAARCTPREVDLFLLRLERYFEDLYLPLVQLYGDRSDARHQFEALFDQIP